MSSTTSSTSTSASGAPASAAGTSTPYAPSPGELAPGLTRDSGRTLVGWDPESAGQWDHGGRTIARRNLVLSVFAEFLGFAVWAVW